MVMQLAVPGRIFPCSPGSLNSTAECFECASLLLPPNPSALDRRRCRKVVAGRGRGPTSPGHPAPGPAKPPPFVPTRSELRPWGRGRRRAAGLAVSASWPGSPGAGASTSRGFVASPQRSGTGDGPSRSSSPPRRGRAAAQVRRQYASTFAVRVCRRRSSSCRPHLALC
jgi:hypothetical protein